MNTVTKSPAEPDINLLDNGASVFLVSQAKRSTVPVSVAWLMDKINQSRYAKAKIDPLAITSWVKAYNSNDHRKDKLKSRVAELIHAQCELKIDPEAMGAYLYITPAMGGTNISRRDILTTVISNRITHGIINRSITEAMQNPHASKLLIAKGKPASHGEDSRFKIVIPELSTQLAKSYENHCKDPRRKLAQPVKDKSPRLVSPGDELVVRYPATKGTNGKDIFGKVISAYQGQQLEYPDNLPGVAISANDPNKLVAAIHGQVVISKGFVKVIPVVNVQNVDTSTGDIDFDGTVHVTENVDAGMKIQAGGDIFIDGRVHQAAQIEACGDIVIKNGVFGGTATYADIDQESDLVSGSENDNGNLLHSAAVKLRSSKGDIYALSLFHADIRAEKSLIVSTQLVQCNVEVGEHVLVGDFPSQPGAIDGGSIKAKYIIQADILGSPDAVLTRMQVGDTQAALTQAKLLESEIQDTNSKRGELEQSLVKNAASQATDGAAKKSKMANLNYINKQILELTKLLMLYRVEQERCLKALQRFNQASIIGGSKINPNLRIKIANHSQTIKKHHAAGRFIVRNNTIVFVAD